MRRSTFKWVLVFLAPNLIGVLAFTLFPILASFFGSFTSWSLQPAVPLRFVGLENYARLLGEPNFYFYLFNTLYLVLALPLQIAGSLALAILLSERLDFQNPRANRLLAGLALGVTLVSATVLYAVGSYGSCFAVAAVGAVGALGFLFGSLTYRTVFYLPHFTAGAATIVLWGQLYNPQFGFFNQAIRTGIEWLGTQGDAPGWLLSSRALLGFLPLPDHFNSGGFGLGAREAIILMGLWAGIGGNQMLLYLAGIANIPRQYFEAAEIDGAGWWQKHRLITIPQLAPITFFVFVMGVIHGLQGGFEQVRIMTQGGPAGTTTTLVYYLYRLGFERLDLGYGSAVAWVLFCLILLLTFLNWKFGNRGYV